MVEVRWGKTRRWWPYGWRVPHRWRMRRQGSNINAAESRGCHWVVRVYREIFWVVRRFQLQPHVWPSGWSSRGCSCPQLSWRYLSIENVWCRFLKKPRISRGYPEKTNVFLGRGEIRGIKTYLFWARNWTRANRVWGSVLSVRIRSIQGMAFFSSWYAISFKLDLLRTSY